MSTKNTIYSGNLETTKALSDKFNDYSIKILLNKRFDTKKCHSYTKSRLLLRLYRMVFENPCVYEEEDVNTIREKVLKTSVLNFKL